MAAGAILITNDDGIDAPGLAALVEVARRFGEPLVVAPTVCHSAKAHAVSMRGEIDLRPAEAVAGAPSWSCSGTPADCVRLGLLQVGRDQGIDRVFSGINPGANLGVDTFYSGTVAAAREAAILGRIGVAVSQLVLDGELPDWAVTQERAGRALARLLAAAATGGAFYNVNLPNRPAEVDPPISVRPLSTQPWPLDFAHTPHPGAGEGLIATYAGRYTARRVRPGTDFDALVAGEITITPLRLDNTDDEALRMMNRS